MEDDVSAIEIETFKKSGKALTASIEMEPVQAAGRTKVPADEMLKYIDSLLQEDAHSLYAQVIRHMRTSVEALISTDKEVPIRIESGYGPCPSCNRAGGGRGQVYYDNIGGVHCYPC